MDALAWECGAGSGIGWARAANMNISTNHYDNMNISPIIGTHVAVGVLYLSALLLSSFRRNGLGSETGLHIETAGLYWHFVDVAWIVIFTVVYLIPA